MESLRWDLKQKVDVVTTLEVDMNVLQEMLIEDLQMEQELELTKVVARGIQEELDIRNNELLMLRKQLEVAQAVANKSDEVVAEARQVIHVPTPQIVIIRLLFCLLGFLLLKFHPCTLKLTSCVSHCVQVAEICRTHPEEKEEETNLLGKSVEELQSAVSA